MRGRAVPSLSLAAFLLAVPAASPGAAQEGVARPDTLLREVVEGMPSGPRQEVRVLTATLGAGDRTVFHTHRFPVTVYVLEGSFALDMNGREPVVVRAGEAMVEPPNVQMVGHAPAGRTRVVIFYVSDPGTPFLDPVVMGEAEKR
jgi:quercetin dioxygenase-like cupin family protein